MKVIELPAHLCQDVGSEVFKNGPFVAEQIALQHIKLRAVFQHGDQQATVYHIDLKYILNSVPVQRQFRQRQIVAAANNACVLNPLQAAGKFGRGSAFFHHGILKLFVLFAELSGYGLKAFADKGLILIVGVLDHVVFIIGKDTALQLEHGIHLVRIHKGLHHGRHAAYHCILQQQLAQLFVQCLRNGRFVIQAFGQILDHRRFNAVCP